MSLTCSVLVQFSVLDLPSHFVLASPAFLGHDLDHRNNMVLIPTRDLGLSLHMEACWLHIVEFEEVFISLYLEYLNLLQLAKFQNFQFLVNLRNLFGGLKVFWKGVPLLQELFGHAFLLGSLLLLGFRKPLHKVLGWNDEYALWVILHLADAEESYLERFHHVAQLALLLVGLIGQV